MYKGTTPDITMTFAEGAVDFDEADNILITIRDFRNALLLEVIPTHTTRELTIFLDQEQTLAFPVGNIFIQANWTYQEGGVTKRACSKIYEISITFNLHNEVMS